ncbi:MEKHLA domain-containing protein [Amycolatopsis sp. NPDC049253]|uniref:MEKHLA domain-containing protein n=1 Tax=Amycolatopsis sp. NPDC049253 TaxID=3155274 RepID=UPI00342DF379
MSLGAGLPDSGSSPLDAAFARLLVDSYRRVVGTPLIGATLDAARHLYAEAPFGLLAHDTADDPRFTYANLVAQHAFERDWTELRGMPSRLSAEPARQEDRDALVHAVATHGFVSGYRGRRIAKSGRRFWIEDVTMWNLIDDTGVKHGQAAMFARITAA